MYDLRLHSIAKKYNGEFGAASSEFSIASGAQVTVTVTIPNGMVGYLMKHAGYATTTDVLTEFKDDTGGIIFDWEELPDWEFEEYMLPFHQRYYKENFKVVFTNNAAGTTTIGFKFSILLIPEPNKAGFEKDIERLTR